MNIDPEEFQALSAFSLKFIGIGLEYDYDCVFTEGGGLYFTPVDESLKITSTINLSEEKVQEVQFQWNVEYSGEDGSICHLGQVNTLKDGIKLAAHRDLDGRIENYLMQQGMNEIFNG